LERGDRGGYRGREGIEGERGDRGGEGRGREERGAGLEAACAGTIFEER